MMILLPQNHATFRKEKSSSSVWEAWVIKRSIVMVARSEGGLVLKVIMLIQGETWFASLVDCNGTLCQLQKGYSDKEHPI